MLFNTREHIKSRGGGGGGVFHDVIVPSKLVWSVKCWFEIVQLWKTGPKTGTTRVSRKTHRKLLPYHTTNHSSSHPYRHRKFSPTKLLNGTVGKFTIIGSDNGLSPGRHQAIPWTNAGILLTGHLGTNCSKILIEIYTFSFWKCRLVNVGHFVSASMC